MNHNRLIQEISLKSGIKFDSGTRTIDDSIFYQATQNENFGIDIYSSGEIVIIHKGNENVFCNEWNSEDVDGIAELVRRYNTSSNLDVGHFIYAQDPSGKWFALNNGKITTTVDRHNDFGLGFTFKEIPVATDYNSYPTQVPCNPITTGKTHELTFNNKIPNEWLEFGFYLMVDGIKFIIESAHHNVKNNKWTTSATSDTIWN